MSGNQLPFRPGTGSDVGNPPTISQIIQAMCTSRSSSPKALELEVHAVQFGWMEPGNADDDTIKILVVPTAVRVVYIEDFEIPDFEFEGWVLEHPDQPWVRGALRRSNEGGVEECTIYVHVLEPGQEMGTKRTPGIN